jgi:hypothetical protein
VLQLIRPHKNVAEILLQPDNAQPHASLETQTAIAKLGLFFPHQPHSPDLTSTDFHLIGGLKDATRSKRFGSIVLYCIYYTFQHIHTRQKPLDTELVTQHELAI